MPESSIPIFGYSVSKSGQSATFWIRRKGGNEMHEKDRWKLLKAGFILYRCSETEKVIKKRTVNDASWKVELRAKSKKAVKMASKALLLDPKVIQD